MRFYTTSEGDSNWAPVAMILGVAVVALLLGYFLLYAPSQQVSQAPVTINNPAPSGSSSPPTTVVVPGTPGQKGDTGNTGNTGKTGSQGDTGDKGTPGNDGKTGDTGAPGTPAPANPPPADPK